MNNDYNFYKYNDEDRDEYIIRVAKAKYAFDKTWDDIAYFLNASLNTNITGDSWRKRVNRLISKADLTNKELYQFTTDNIKARDENNTVNAMYRRLAREDSIKEIAHDIAETFNRKFPYIDNPYIRNNTAENKSAILLISDWHYGIDIKNIFNEYNTDIAEQRVSELLDATINTCNKENISDLHIVNLGDMIAGNIHLPIRLNSRVDIITQIIEVSELIAKFINMLKNNGLNITYYSCLDNHSRIDPNKKNALQLESLARVTDWYLKERVPNINYVSNEYGLDIADLHVQGMNILAVHGDKDNQSSMLKSLTSFTQKKWDIICSAHMHHFSADEDNDTLRISNGALMGTDDYATSLRMNSKPSQTMLIIEDSKLSYIKNITFETGVGNISD